MAEMLERATTAAIIANACLFGWGLADPAHAEMAEAAEQAITLLFVGEMAWRWRLDGLARLGAVQRAGILSPWPAPCPGSAVLRLARLAKLVKRVHLGRHAAQLRVVALARRREGVAG
jgi:hypothetical protein